MARLPKDAIPVLEAAARYLVARRTIDRWAHEGKLRLYRSDAQGDTKMYVRTSVLERLLKAPAAPRGKPGQWRPRPDPPSA